MLTAHQGKLTSLQSMAQPPRWISAIAVALLIALALPAQVHALELRSGDDVRIGPGETITGDLYIFGGQVNVEGRVTGDLVAAGGNVRVSGPVGGSVNAAGGDVSIIGPVAGSARLAGGNVNIGSAIEGDVAVGTGNLVLESSARIGRDLVFSAGQARLDGAILGSIRGGGESVTLNGPVGRDVYVEVNQLAVGAGARLGGDLRYQSASEASIAPAAQIAGQRVRTDPPLEERRQPGPLDWLPGFLLGWLMPLVLGGILVLLWPLASVHLADELVRQPWMSLVIGMIVLVVVPFMVLALLITVLGIPAALALLAVYLIALYLSQAVTALTVGRTLITLARHQWTASRGWLLAALALGLLLIALLQALPVPALGFMTGFFSLLFGLGALWLGLTRLHRGTSQMA